MSDTSPGGFQPYTAEPWPVSQSKVARPPQVGSKVNDFETLSRLRHALRTPLNQIIGYTEMLMESAEESHAASLLRDLKKIHTAGGQLLALLNDALAPWKIETGKIDLVTMRQDMVTPLNAVISFSEVCATDSAVSETPSIGDDLGKIRQAARNLFALIEGESELGDIASNTLGSNLGGSAEAALGPAPTPPNQTAPFFDFLGAEKNQLTTGRILVVDDDSMNREMLSRRLRKMGYKVREADNGNRALDELKQRPFDLVLLDIIMPELDGFRTLEFMKTDPMLRHVPVIMLTALDEVESTVRCIEAGAEEYVPGSYQRLAREETTARSRAGRPPPASIRAEQIGAPAAQRIAPSHRRPPQAGRAHDCRQLSRVHGGLCRHRGFHPDCREVFSEPHRAVTQ
jgi:CheY-like chemotaxis protein